MVTVKNETKNAIIMVEGKGDPIVITGPTEGGKSTANGSQAKSEVTQELLATREASGKGSTSEVSIIATDYSKIPEDNLIVTAKLCPKSIADCNDDNEMLGTIIYSAAKDYDKNPDISIYQTKLSKALQYTLEQPANESLAYKLKGMTVDDNNTLMEILLKFQIDDVMIVYNEMRAKNPKKGQKGVRIFTELLSERGSFSDAIQIFWDYAVEVINRGVSNLKQQLEESGADIEELPDGTTKFIAMLGIEDINSDITNTLLKSEDGSKEYLLADISLIFRGADYLFDVRNADYLVVSEYGGEKIHCVRFIDTQGLFHAAGVKPKDESERIIDMLSEYHSNKLVLVVNSFVTDTVKNSYEAIRMMLQEANRDIEIYILYTHWDEYLKDYSQRGSDRSRFSRGKVTVDWYQKFADASHDQDNLTQMFKNSLLSNSSKRKPVIVGTYRAAILSDPESKMEDVLEENHIVYPSALHNLMEDMLREESQRGHKHRLKEGINDCFSIDVSACGNQNIAALYDNMVGECKNLKLYASTVRASNRRWIGSGTVHISRVNANDYGYTNIETRFVQEIRNYAMTFTNKLIIDVTPYITDKSEADRFTEDLRAYLAYNQNVGREVAKLIGDEAYKNGFVKETGFRYQYERFTDMIQYTQDNYFMAKNIPFTNAFEKCLHTAIKKVINNFVDARCIVVY